MERYGSIETIWVRSKENGKLIFGEYRIPEHALIKEWRIREKVDGTNIRVIITRVPELNGTIMEVKGRSDNAQLPSGMMQVIEKIFTLETLEAISQEYIPDIGNSITFYGEGYGRGITGSEKMDYRPDGKWFRCFDIKLQSDPERKGYWVNDCALDPILRKFNIPGAPFIGIIQSNDIPVLPTQMPITMSIVQHEDYYEIDDEYPEQQAEGIVAKPAYTLFDAHGDRIMWKLCNREWK